MAADSSATWRINQQKNTAPTLLGYYWTVPESDILWIYMRIQLKIEYNSGVIWSHCCLFSVVYFYVVFGPILRILIIHYTKIAYRRNRPGLVSEFGFVVWIWRRGVIPKFGITPRRQMVTLKVYRPTTGEYLPRYLSILLGKYSGIYFFGAYPGIYFAPK